MGPLTSSYPAPSHPVAEDVAWYRVDDISVVGTARRTAVALAGQLGFGGHRGAEVGLAVTEIATNLHRYTRDGALLLRSVRGTGVVAVELVAVDSGPGIPDTDLACEDGRSTGGTLGLGLGAVERLADTFDISSVLGRGTVLVAGFHAEQRGTPHPVPAPVSVAGLTRAITGELGCGDAYAVWSDAGLTTLMLCDGLGHGPLAASAAQQAVRTFLDERSAAPEVAVQHIHQALKSTRGGAVAVAELDPKARQVRFAGVGNVAGAVLSDGKRQSMVSVPGIAGYQARTIRTFTYELPGDAVVVLHSDGVSERWGTPIDEGLLRHGPLVIAATILRDGGLHHDDACVVAAKTKP